MSQPYKSGRQQDLNLGITSVTENRTVLQTIGKVGIGTTNAQNHSLFVVGSTNIIGDVNITGISTLNDVVADNLDLVNIDASGIGTIANLDVTTSFNVYAPGATFHQDLTVLGNVSIGGTTQVLIGQELRIKDKEIILGVTTAPGDPTGDYSTDDTANHGGVAIASTVGSPLVSLKAVGINTLPDTYKQIMWVKSNTMGFGTTDAWLFNYAVGIGSTQVPNDVRLAVGGVQVTDHSITAQTGNFNRLSTTNLYTSGVGTVVTLDSTTSNILNLNVTNANINTGIVTNISGTNLYYSGVGSITTLNSTDATITNLSGTRISVVDINSTGVVTATKFDGSLATITQGNITSASGTNLNYTGIGTLGTVTTNQLTSANINVAGVVTARQFIGDINAGVATITQGNIANVNATTLNVSGISTINDLYVAGLSTFVGLLDANGGAEVDNVRIGIADDNTIDTSTGNLTLDSNSGTVNITDQLNVSGVSTLASLGGITTTGGDLYVGGDLYIKDDLFFDEFTARNATITGFSTLGIASATNLYVSGISTFVGVTTHQSTVFGTQLSISGFSTLSTLHAPKLTYNGSDFGGTGYLPKADGTGGWVWADVPGIFSVNNILNGFNVKDEGLIVGTAGSITTLDFRGVNIVATADPQPNGIATIRLSETPTFLTLDVSGISTFAGITTVTGDTLFAKQLNISGVSTFAGIGTFNNDLYVGGNLYIQNDLVFDEATLRNLNITGISTLGIATASQLYVSGVTTTGNLTVNSTSLFQGGIQANSTISALGGVNGNLTGNVTSTGSNSFGQATVTGVVTARQFIGDVQAGVATITQGNITNASGSTLSYTGLSTITDISSAGISVSGVVTSRQFIGDINSGIATITQGNITNSSGSTLSYTGLSTITDISASGISVSGVVTARQFVGDINAGFATITQASVSGVITARQFVGDINAGVSTITQGNITNASGSTLNYIGLSTITDISASGISVSGVVTARQFVGDINAGVGTITSLNSTSANLTNINSTGISTLNVISANEINLNNINVTGVVTARQFIGDIQAGIATITQGNIANANGSTLNYIGLSTITDISSAGISVSGVVTARQFVGDINSGIATITQGNITNVSGSTLSYTGLSTITDISASGIRVSGVVTARQFVGDINAGIATITTIFGTEAFFTGNVSIGGTLSYEDVTNVDSIGVITARSDVRVGGNLSVVGVTTLASAGGITTTGGDLYVGDDLFFNGNIYQNGQLFTSGIGIGSTSVNPGSGLINAINNRIGVGFTDINIVGTGISVTGYGSTVVIDFGNIAAASGGALSISTVFSPRIQDVSFVGGASTSIIGISTQTDRFVFDTQTGSVGIGTSSSSIPQYKLDVVGDINTSTSVKVKGVDVLEEAVRLAIAFG